MEYTAAEIAAFLGGTVEGDPQVRITAFNKIEEGKPGGISFLANPKYTPYIYTSQASAVLVNRDFTPEQPIAATLIRVDDAYACLAKLMQMTFTYRPKKAKKERKSVVARSARLDKGVYIGSFAYISEHAVIGRNAQIYPQVFIGENVRIGDDCIIYPGVKIYHDCVIGNRCVLHAGCVIGADGFGFAPQDDGTYKKIPQTGNVVIEDDVEICANTCVDRATMGSTVIHKGVKLDNLIQIAHNVEVGENTVMAAQCGIAGSTKIGKQCMFGGQSGVAGHLHIPDGLQMGAQTGMLGNPKECDKPQLGTPALPLKTYLRAYAMFKNLPDVIAELKEKNRQLREELDQLKSKVNE